VRTARDAMNWLLALVPVDRAHDTSAGDDL
jgi:hypothetical protein